jgi:hypothetical protein
MRERNLCFIDDWYRLYIQSEEASRRFPGGVVSRKETVGIDGVDHISSRIEGWGVSKREPSGVWMSVPRSGTASPVKRGFIP